MKHWHEAVLEACQFISHHAPNSELDIKLRTVRAEMEEAYQWLLPDWRHMDKPVMTLDFDGVISQYRHGWNGPGNLDGELPVPGAIEFIERAVEHFTVLIFSSRCNSKDGIQAIQKWLSQYTLSEAAIKQLYFQPGKPSAFIMIDDRALHFEGVWDLSPADLREHFAPWYYSVPGWRHAQGQSNACIHNLPHADCSICRGK